MALTETLLDYGASLEDCGAGEWASPLMTALAFGYRDVAEALVRRGARTDNVAAAAGLGRCDELRRGLAGATPLARHKALALAAQHGQLEAVRILLDAGEDPNRLNPEGNHSHSTPLHQAALVGHRDIVRLLVERGAQIDVKDSLWQSTPLGWALHGEQKEVAEYLRQREAQSGSSDSSG